MLPLMMASALGPTLTGGAASVGAAGLFDTASKMFGSVSPMLGSKPPKSETVTAISGLKETGAMTVTQAAPSAGSGLILIVVAVGCLALILKRK